MLGRIRPRITHGCLLPSTMTHWAHDVVATLNQRRRRWFKDATASCVQWGHTTWWEPVSKETASTTQLLTHWVVCELLIKVSKRSKFNVVSHSMNSSSEFRIVCEWTIQLESLAMITNWEFDVKIFDVRQHINVANMRLNAPADSDKVFQVVVNAITVNNILDFRVKTQRPIMRCSIWGDAESQKAETTHSSGNQILPFGFAQQCRFLQNQRAVSAHL